MGRGASRSKSGGIMVMVESERKIAKKNDNISYFAFLQTGCFEKDILSYCSNRLTDYSCLHWLEPPEDEQKSANSTDPYINNQCYHANDFSSQILVQITYILLPPLLICAFFASLISMPAFRRIKRLHTPALYLFVLTGFDLFEIIIRGTDHLIDVFWNVKVVYSLQIISRSSCQMLPFGFNLFKHFQASLYSALAIDNWRFVKNPRQIYQRYRPEWIRNVFIVLAAILVTLNSQFFWTFDVTENDNIPLHNRLVKTTFECSFSKTWPLKLGFIEYFWPIADHFTCELLPTLLTLVFSIRSLLSIANQKWESNLKQVDNLRKYIIDLDLLIEMNRFISWLCLVYGLMSIPNSFYFISKYISHQLYSDSQLGKNVGISDPSTRNSKSRFIINPKDFQSVLYKERQLNNLEFVIHHLFYMFFILKFFILLKNVTMARNIVYKLIKLPRSVIKRSPCKSLNAHHNDKDGQQTNSSQQSGLPTSTKSYHTSSLLPITKQRFDKEIERNDQPDSVMITFKHRSASCNSSGAKPQEKSLLHCSYNM